MSRDLSAQPLNLMVLDAMWQLSSNPTSKTAGLAWEENFHCIRENLHLRYGVQVDEASTVLEKAWTQYHALLDRFVNYYSMRDYMRAHAAGLSGSVISKVAQSSRDTQVMVALLNYYKAKGADEYTLKQLFDSESRTAKALLRSVLPEGEILDFSLVMRELIAAGVINRLFYRSCKGEGDHSYEMGIHLPAVSLEAVLPPESIPEPKQYVKMLFQDRRMRDARVLDLTAKHGYPFPGVHLSYPRCVPVLPDHPSRLRGVLGVDGDRRGYAVAVNPRNRSGICEAMSYAKRQRTWEDLRMVEEVLRDLSGQYTVTKIAEGEGNYVWEVSGTIDPRCYVYLAPWIDINFLRRTAGLDKEDRVLFIMVEESVPTMEQDVAEWRGQLRLVSLSGTKIDESRVYNSPQVFALIMDLLRNKVEALAHQQQVAQQLVASREPTRTSDANLSPILQLIRKIRCTLAEWIRGAA